MNCSSGNLRRIASLALAASVMALGTHVNAQQNKAAKGPESKAKGIGGADARFEFLTPWDDAKANFVDVSSLNDGPAGSHGLIVVKDGHFVESDTGRRVRFLGTNLCFDGLYPSNEDAEAIAAHLAKYGMNVVRLHHQDTTFKFPGPEGRLWDPNYADNRHIDASQLEKMDYLVAQLEKRGIYIDMCLHVSRKFTPADGFPEGVSKIPFPFDKRVDIFDPQMIAIDKEYFRDLLTHVNPYTGKTYAADPGLLNVEINNENSLMGLYGDMPGSGLYGLPAPYDKELSDLWNAWLLKKYGTTEKLAAAWKSADQTTGPNLYPPSNDHAKWTLEVQSGNAATIKSDDGGVRVDVSKASGTDWQLRAYQKGLGLLENGKRYTITMEMKADADCVLGVGAYLDAPLPPNHVQLGLFGRVNLTTHWETFSLVFKATKAQDGHNLLPVLNLGTRTGSTWIRDITLKEGTGGFILSPSQTLEAGTVLIEPSGSLAPRADWLQFLADTEMDYVNDMRSYLRKDLGVKQSIFCSQMGYGGLWANYREAGSDYIDDHGYWECRNTLYEIVKNQPMVRTLASRNTLSRMAMDMNAGQPVSVTEFNHCFPNEYRAEMMPGYASIAAFQDWDAIFVFCHQSYGAKGAKAGQLDRMRYPLEASVDPAVWGFMPSAAMMFRGGLVPIAPAERILAMPEKFPADKVAKGLTVAKAWEDKGVNLLDAFKYRLRLGIGLPDALPDPSAPAGVLKPEVADPQTARYVADAPSAKVVFGFVGGQTVPLTGAAVTFGHLTNNFGALTLVAMDSKPLAQSSRILLTLVTHTQNKGQTWNEAHSMLDKVGEGPPEVDAAAATVSLAADGPRTVFTLDGSGEKQDRVPSTYKDGQVSFAITPAQKSIWFAITKP
jgi:Carbohydrate binding domain